MSAPILPEPPRFIEDGSDGGDITVKEGDTVTLPCRAEGNPDPTIKWTREDGKDIVGGIHSKYHQYDNFSDFMFKNKAMN